MNTHMHAHSFPEGTRVGGGGGTPACIFQCSDQGDGRAYRKDEEGGREKTTMAQVWQRHGAVIINSCQWALKPSLDREAVPNGLCFFPVCLCVLMCE